MELHNGQSLIPVNKMIIRVKFKKVTWIAELIWLIDFD